VSDYGQLALFVGIFVRKGRRWWYGGAGCDLVVVATITTRMIMTQTDTVFCERNGITGPSISPTWLAYWVLDVKWHRRNNAGDVNETI